MKSRLSLGFFVLSLGLMVRDINAAALAQLPQGADPQDALSDRFEGMLADLNDDNNQIDIDQANELLKSFANEEENIDAEAVMAGADG